MYVVLILGLVILRVAVTYIHTHYASICFVKFKIITKKPIYCLMSGLFYNKHFTQIN